MAKVTFSVPMIDCESCVRIIRSQLGRTAGVKDVDVDVRSKRVSVEYDPQQTTPEAVEDQLERSGFPPGETKVEPRLSEERPAAPRPIARPSPGRPRAVWYWLLAAGVVVLAVAGYTGYEVYPRFGLPRAEGAALLLLATAAGIASFFSPCSFTLLVTLLARQTGVEARRREPQPTGRAMAFAGGLSIGAAAFLLLSGLVIALGGQALLAGITFTSPAGITLRILAGVALIGLGLIQMGILPNYFHGLEHVATPVMRTQARYRRRSPFLGFTVLGFGYVLAGLG